MLTLKIEAPIEEIVIVGPSATFGNINFVEKVGVVN